MSLIRKDAVDGIAALLNDAPVEDHWTLYKSRDGVFAVLVVKCSGCVGGVEAAMNHLSVKHSTKSIEVEKMAVKEPHDGGGN